MIHASGTRLPFTHPPLPSMGSRAKLPDNFAIYTFPLKPEDIVDATPWRLQRICTDGTQALREARNLYHSRRYARIEVRRRYTDEETGALRDEAVHILDAHKNKKLHTITAVFVTVGMCVCIATLLVLFR